MQSHQFTLAGWHDSPKSYVPPDLNNTSHVYVRRDGYKPPLTYPYKGPYCVLHNANKHFTVEVKGKATEISVKCLELAKVEARAPSPNFNLATASSSPAMQQPQATMHNDTLCGPVTTCRSGRSLRQPSTVQDYIDDWQGVLW